MNMMSVIAFRGDVTKPDPFLNLLNTYMQGQLLFTRATNEYLTENRSSRCTRNGHDSAESRERYYNIDV